MKPNSILTLAAAAILGLGATFALAGDRAARSIELSPGTWAGSAPILDAGGYSLSTGDHLTGEAAYLTVHVEGADGRAHPAFGGNAQGMYVFATYDGRYVVRFMDGRSTVGTN